VRIMRSAWLAWSGVCATVAAFSVAVACGGSAFTSAGGPDASSSSSGGRDGSSSGSGSGSGSGSSSGGTKDGGRPPDASAGDGATLDGGATCPGSPTRCGGSLTCNGTGGQQGDVCCISSPTASPTYGCAACGCGCEDTQLDCTRMDNCGGTGQVCCIVATPCGGGSHYVATCQDRVTCGTGGGKVMCIPGGTGQECIAGSCSPDTGGVGIPANSGYGICN